MGNKIGRCTSTMVKNAFLHNDFRYKNYILDNIGIYIGKINILDILFGERLLLIKLCDFHIMQHRNFY